MLAARKHCSRSLANSEVSVRHATPNVRQPPAAFLKDELVENVGHCLWTFTLPKMLRPYFMRNRELLADLARLAYELHRRAHERCRRRPQRPPGRRRDDADIWQRLEPSPHAHCIASRGVWDEQGQWLPVSYIDTLAAEKGCKNTFISIEPTPNRRPLVTPSARRDPRHRRVYRSGAHPDPRASVPILRVPGVSGKNDVSAFNRSAPMTTQNPKTIGCG